MKEVKSQQRYKCDFCKKRGIKSRIAKHELTCYRNPQRVCFNCKNGTSSGMWTDQESGECIACMKFDEQKLKEIEAREKGEIAPLPNKLEPTF